MDEFSGLNFGGVIDPEGTVKLFFFFAGDFSGIGSLYLLNTGKFLGWEIIKNFHTFLTGFC